MADEASDKVYSEELARAAKRAQTQSNYSAAPAAPAVAAPAPVDKVTVSARARRRAEAAGASPTSVMEKAQASALPEPAPVGVMAERAWLDRIEKLLEQGRKAEAVADWKAFREVYPNYPVPDATRAKLD